MTDTMRFAVFGHPVAHSLSPRLHALFAAQFDIALEYDAIDVASAGFATRVGKFFAAGGQGLNVTLPHKAAAFALADACTSNVQCLGVANVMTRLPDGRIEADSNDGAGMLADLRGRCGVELRDRGVLLLGAGGAARAAAFALLDAGVRSLAVANRTCSRAQTLVEALAGPLRVRVLRWEELEHHSAFDLVVNATSAGVQNAALALPASLLEARSVAYDLSYGAAAWPFIEWAKRAGCSAAFDGLGMLVETAAATFERWHGVRPDTEAAYATISRDSRS